MAPIFRAVGSVVALPIVVAVAAAGTAAPGDAFDCGMRRLAYDFGRQLLPRLGRFESLWYALGLNSQECPSELEPLQAVQPPPPVAGGGDGPGADLSGALFVDAARGDDQWKGSRRHPLRTLHEAVRRGGGAAKTIVLREGTHRLAQEGPLLLGSEHSGLTIRAHAGERPVVSGAVRIDAQWAPHDVQPAGSWELFPDTSSVMGDEEIDGQALRDYGDKADAASCQEACEADAWCAAFTWQGGSRQMGRRCLGRTDGRWSTSVATGHVSGRRAPAKNIYRANILGQVSDVPGLQLNGERATRARYPNLEHGIETSPEYGGMIDGGKAKWTRRDLNQYGKTIYHTDNLPEHLRNTSADGWFRNYMIGTGGLCSVYDPPVSFWCNEHPEGGGAFAFRTPSGMVPHKGVLPNAPYRDVSEMVVNVWRPSRWANWMFEVEHYDAATGNFTFGRGGNQGARGHESGGDFFVENVFEELDAPGEFFFNRTTGDLFLFYNGTGAPPAGLEVEAPQLRTLINVTGTQWDPVRGVTLDGLTFRAARYTYMDPHGVPSAGDWALDRISAVFVQGAEGVTIQNSVFERLDGNAVMLSGYNRNVTVQDNDFAYIGGNAIISWGYTNETATSGFPYYIPRDNFPDAGIDGTDGNHPRFNAILRNSAREVGLYEKQSSFYMQAKTAQSTISGNVFFNGPRAGINYNDGFGGGDELSSNLVFNTCRESGDHGPFNSWDRQPYLTTVRTGEPSMVMEWREIHHNFFIDNYSPQENIDNDDGSCYYRSHHNFLVYGGNGMKNDFGGHDNWQYDNIYAFAGAAMSVDKTLPGHEDHFHRNRVVLTNSKIGRPQCKGARTQMSDNSYFTPDGALKVCGKSFADAQRDGFELRSNVSTTPGGAEILGWARSLLSIGRAARESVLVV